MQVLDMLRGARFDLLILDINMPDRGGLDILKHVRASYPEVRVLVLSGYSRAPVRSECAQGWRGRLPVQGRRAGRTAEGGDPGAVGQALRQPDAGGAAGRRTGYRP